MTDQADGSSDPVDLGKRDAGQPQDATQGFEPSSAPGGAHAQASAPEDDPDFDPYRFGAPEHPVPPEYAPPGYKPPQQPSGTPDPYSPYGTGSPYGPGSPYGTGLPYGPGSPYGPPAGQPGPYGQPAQQSPYGPPPQSPYGPPPQQSPYGPPPGYQQGGYPQPGGGAFDGPPQGNGKAVTSLVLGILSILLCWTVYLDFLLVIPGFVFGVIVVSNRSARSRKLAWAGVICSSVGAVLAIVLTIVAVHLANNCQDLSGSDLRQCVSDQL